MLDRNFQTTACRNLLHSVVALSVSDACGVPPKKSREQSRFPISIEAFTAMRFLFDKTQSGIDAYALWLDFDADRFREKLLKIMNNNSAVVVAGFEPERRRNFRFNYGVWFRMQNAGVVDLSEVEDESEADH